MKLRPVAKGKKRHWPLRHQLALRPNFRKRCEFKPGKRGRLLTLDMALQYQRSETALSSVWAVRAAHRRKYARYRAGWRGWGGIFGWSRPGR